MASLRLLVDSRIAVFLTTAEGVMNDKARIKHRNSSKKHHSGINVVAKAYGKTQYRERTEMFVGDLNS